MERTSANLSIRLAIFGNSSEIWMPGTLVEIGLKLLLVFGSQVSTWLGPPSSQNRIPALALPLGVAESAAAASASRRESPKKPREPAVIKLRRVVGCCISPSLMILREFTCANQGPHEFAQPG